MPQSKGYERMNELVASLQRALHELEAGRLDLAGLDHCTDEARALYERLVVLRHKAREAAAQTAPALPEREAMRLDTRPDVPLRQTSLIDAIAEADAPESQEPPKTVKEKPAKKQGSLAERLEHAPVTDLQKAITLSQKFWFMAELFGGQKERYDRTITAINNAADLAAAQAIVQREVLEAAPKPPGEEVLGSFNELVERRFQG